MSQAASQLDTVTEVLIDTAANVWLDSGSLLGVYRDGKLPASDPDIDLGCWASDNSGVDRVRGRLRDCGYTENIYNYKGTDVAYALRPQNTVGDRSVNISVYQHVGDNAWMPAFRTPNPYNPFSIRYFITGIPNQIQAWYLGAGKRLFGYKPISGRLPQWNAEWKHWMIPAHFFDNLTQLERYGVYAPSPVCDYLEYRYGDWETPDPEWNYWTDDNSLRDEPPKAL